MSARFLLIIAGAVVLGLSACKKEFVAGETIEVVDTVSATNATTVSFSHGWSGSLTIGDEGSTWSVDDTLGGLRIPIALQAGDRLIATLQVGLQQNGAHVPCVDSLYVFLGAVLGGEFAVTPVSPGVVPFDGAFTMATPWEYSQPELIKLFTRQQELIVGNDMPVAIVQTFVKMRSMDDGCTPDAIPCNILNRSLTLTVIHP